MLEVFKERSNEKNITTILSPIEEISLEKLGSFDVVISSRALNGIIPIDEILKTINEIANKYVFITVFGPENWKIERDFKKYINQEEIPFPEYNYLFNILFNMGIYPNVERLSIPSYRTYDTIEEAMDNGKFRVELLNNEEKGKLREYLQKILKKDPETGKLFNEKDKADWILIWWKKT